MRILVNAAIAIVRVIENSPIGSFLFILRYAKRTCVSVTWLMMNKDCVKCDCGDTSCEGWCMVPKGENISWKFSKLPLKVKPGSWKTEEGRKINRALRLGLYDKIFSKSGGDDGDRLKENDEYPYEEENRLKSLFSGLCDVDVKKCNEFGGWLVSIENLYVGENDLHALRKFICLMGEENILWFLDSSVPAPIQKGFFVNTSWRMNTNTEGVMVGILTAVRNDGTEIICRDVISKEEDEYFVHKKLSVVMDSYLNRDCTCTGEGLPPVCSVHTTGNPFAISLKKRTVL